MARDIQFAGYDHESLPDVGLDFSRKSPDARQPEAVVDVWSRQHCEWIRVPITHAETRVNKDGPADLTYTSRIDCPATWGKTPNGEEKIPIYDYVGASDKTENPTFDLARVYYWNQYTESYSIEQFGYIASIGPTSENGEFRFYVYDTADLMKSMPVTKTYDEPSASSIVNFVAFDATYGVDENTPVPVRGVATTSPAEDVVDGTVETFNKGVTGWLDENTPIVTSPEDESLAESLGITSGNWNNDFTEWLDDVLNAGGHKHFRRNKHTLVDLMNWLTDEIGGAWYFEPVDSGVVLTVNNGAEEGGFSIARSAYYDGEFDPSGLEYMQGFNPAAVDVINNSSLEDLKPINHLELSGESADSFLGVTFRDLDREVEGPRGAPGSQTDKYPHASVTYPPLLERTGGVKLGPKPIESSVTTVAEAKTEVVKEFKKRHEDNTDGSIEVRALPSIRPYDYIGAVPVCNDTFDADMDPIQYEVNSVVHKVTGEDPYKTSLGVSIALDEDALEVTGTLKDIEEDTEQGDEPGNRTETTTEIDDCDPPA